MLIRIVVICCVLAAFVAGCAPAAPPPLSPPVVPAQATVDDALVQFSLVAALAAGDYDGDTPLREVLRDGDFGVGTFRRLDGEMIVLDGQMYQALADGSIRAADLESTTPFAAVKFFSRDGGFDNFVAATLDDLDSQLDRKLPRRNAPYAIRIDGEFPELTLRSVPAQSPPYQPLVSVVKQQVTHELHDLRGTLIGLRCPAWIGTLNVAGYHWHFLSDDRKTGGHVLACELRNGTLAFDECKSVVIHLPQSDEFETYDATVIKKQDIDEIERQRVKTKE
jgi:acetolactate decarboxylase